MRATLRALLLMAVPLLLAALYTAAHWAGPDRPAAVPTLAVCGVWLLVGYLASDCRAACVREQRLADRKARLGRQRARHAGALSGRMN